MNARIIQDARRWGKWILVAAAATGAIHWLRSRPVPVERMQAEAVRSQAILEQTRTEYRCRKSLYEMEDGMIRKQDRPAR